MNMTSFTHVGLLLHIIGLTTIGGVTLASYITSRKFWNQYIQDKQKGFAIMQAVSKLPMLAGIGMGLLILSGIMMVGASRGIYGQQLWFKIKMVFVILIIAAAILRGRLDKRLHSEVLDDIAHGNRTNEIARLVSKLANVQLIILSFFLIIFVLAVFRFN
jgi:uncharacterized membrane protein